MDYISAFEISASGMNIEQLKLQLVARNIAAANTVAKPNQQVYQPQRIIAGTAASFNQALAEAQNGASPKGVEVKEILTLPVDARKVHDPGHPFADENGYVRYANINLVAEMLQMIESSRAYEANVQAFNAAKNMAMRALEIGGRQ